MKHCYKDGWLSDFFYPRWKKNSEWLQVFPTARQLSGKTSAARPRPICPTASYTEMLEWGPPHGAFPPALSRSAQGVQAARPRSPLFPSRRFVGAAFFRKYPESNPAAQENAPRLPHASPLPPPRGTMVQKSNDELLQGARLALLARRSATMPIGTGIFLAEFTPRISRHRSLAANLIRAEAIADRQTPGGPCPRASKLPGLRRLTAPTSCS